MVAKDIEKVVLPEYVTRVMFDCFEQQMMTVCQFYRGEFWKLFIGQKFFYSGKKSESVTDLYEYKWRILISAREEYGISISEIEKKEVIFNDKDLYIFEIDREYYDCTQDIEGEGSHDVIVYGQDCDNYYISDNYYNYSSRRINKNELDPGIVRCYKVNLDTNYCDRGIIYSDIFAINIKKEYELLCDAFLKSDDLEYSSEIIDLFTILFKFCNKLSLIIRSIKESEYNEYLIVCAEVVGEIVKEINNSVYSIIKCVFKDEDINYKAAKERMLVCAEKIKIIQSVVVETKKIIDKDNPIADSLKSQLEKYVEENEEIGTVSEYESVFLTHNKLTVLFFLSFLERENSITGLDYSEIEKLVTYKDFLLLAYKKVLYQHSIYS